MLDTSVLRRRINFISFFFFNDTATTEIYTLSLHDALPISSALARPDRHQPPSPAPVRLDHAGADGSRPLPADRRQAARAPARPMQRHHLPRPTLGPRHLELATATCRPGLARGVQRTSYWGRTGRPEHHYVALLAALDAYADQLAARIDAGQPTD